jgi:GNAT superfamily N-acetyltransferase
MTNWTISNLRQRPEFVDVIADRCWTAWWIDSPVSPAEYRSWVQACVDSAGVPASFVAHRGERYLGSVKLIASDLEARPHYTPWIAALWVEATQRRQGIAAQLMDAAREEAKRCGHDTLYLCASPANSPYYLARGFEQIEADVTGLNVFSLATHHSFLS